MNVKLWKKSLTFVVIPDPNKPVKRIRIPLVLAYGAPLAIVSIVAAGIAFYQSDQRSLHKAQMLESEMNQHKQAYATTLNDKDRVIEQLKTEVVSLSSKTDEMKSKVDELKQLESELLGISSAGGSVLAGKPVASAGQDSQATDGAGTGGNVRMLASEQRMNIGLGGPYIPVSDEEIVRLSADTSGVLTDMAGDAERLKKSLSEAKTKAIELERIIRTTPSIFPSGRTTVTSGFGYRRDPFTYSLSFHDGIDFGGDIGDPVYTTADGVVSSTGYDSQRGNNIVINHGNGLKTWYMHLSKILVNEGDSVKKGGKIGLLGSTGRSTGPHVHYSVLKNGSYVDPKPYLKSMRKEAD